MKKVWALVLAAFLGAMIWELASLTLLRRVTPSSPMVVPTQLSPTPSSYLPGSGVTAPKVKIERLITEWDPQEAVIVSVPLRETLNRPELLEFYAELFRATAPYLDILALVEEGAPDRLSYFLQYLEGPGECSSIMDRIHIFSSDIGLRWIRDFGPVFGVSDQKRLVALDPIYRDLNWENLESALVADSKSGQEVFRLKQALNIGSDTAPVYISVILNRLYDVTTQLVRPPIQLEGGYFITNGQGDVFLSMRTLIRNGGDEEELEMLFRDFFGVQRIHLLDALPGETVDHLDMLVKYISPNKVLIADGEEFDPARFTQSGYRRFLVRETRKAIDFNSNYFKSHLPNTEVVKIPMPPPVFKTNEEIILETRVMLMRSLGQKWGWNVGVYDDSPSSIRQLERRVNAKIGEDWREVDLQNPTDLNETLKHYFNSSLEKQFQIFAETNTVFRSYINSLLIQNSRGQKVVLIPSYKGRNAEERAMLEAMEIKVSQLYRQHCPGYEQVKIPCDALASDLAAIHCVAITAPVMKDFIKKPIK